MPGLETTIFELDKWQGLDVYSSPTDMDSHSLSDCQNIDFFEDGIIQKRRGLSAGPKGTSFSSPINMIYDFQSQRGFTGSGDLQRILIAHGTALSVISNFGRTGETVDFSATISNALHYATTANNGVCYISNENGGAAPKLLTYLNGGWIFRSAELIAPTAGPTGVQGGTGSLSGDYRFRYSYEDAYGNESNMSTASSVVTITGTCVGTVWVGKSVDVGVGYSSDQTVGIINIYCKVPQASIYQWAGSTSNSYSSTGNVTVNLSVTNAFIQAGEPGPLDNYPCPYGKYVTLFNNMLVVAGDPTLPDKVSVSNNGFHREFGANSYDRVTSGDGQAIKGFGRSFNELVIGKADSLYRAAGKDPTSFSASPYNPEYGVLGQPSMTFFYQRLAFFSDDGIYADNALVPVEISKRIRNLLQRLNPANLAVTPPKQYCANDKYYKRIIWAVREAAGAGENDALYVWNYERDCWTRWTGVSCTCLAAIQIYQDYEYVYGGDANGKVFWVTSPSGASPNYDDFSGTNSTISAYATSPWINLPKALQIPTWDRVRTELQKVKIYAGGEGANGSTASITLTMNWYSDFSSTIRGTFTTTHHCEPWPAVTIDPKTVTLTGNQGTVNWFKFKITNNDMDVHFKIFKMVFFFKLKPMVDK
jgi:hypothetical protein